MTVSFEMKEELTMSVRHGCTAPLSSSTGPVMQFKEDRELSCEEGTWLEMHASAVTKKKTKLRIPLASSCGTRTGLHELSD